MLPLILLILCVLLLLAVVVVIGGVSEWLPVPLAWQCPILRWRAWLLAHLGTWLAFRSVPQRVARSLASSSTSSTTTVPQAELIAWVESFLPTLSSSSTRHLQHVEVSTEGMGGGFIGAMFKLILSWEEKNEEEEEHHQAYPRTIVVKTLTPTFERRVSSILLGNAREACFYHALAGKASVLRSIVPHVYHTSWSWLTGDFVLVMEDLQREQHKRGRGRAYLGRHILGNQCWGPVPLPDGLETEEASVQMLEDVFTAMADVHAAFWHDQALLRNNLAWLKGVDWAQGRGRPRWELAMSSMRCKWASIKQQQQQSSTSPSWWSAEVMEAMDNCLQATNWETYRRSFDISKLTTAFTLCHGDFHAANVLWVPPPTQQEASRTGPRVESVRLVDWPEVGIGCPFTELAQFMISNATISLRRKHERPLFAAYHARLIAGGVCERTFPLEDCWAQYERGGVERWLQMLTLMACMGIPDAAMRWFHDQVAAFIHDHAQACPTPFISAYPMILE